MSTNTIGLKGISFVEFSALEPSKLEHLFADFGFSRRKVHTDRKISLYRQNEINFILNAHPGSFGSSFAKVHGPSISAMGWYFKNAEYAFNIAIQRGAKACDVGDYDVPAIYGIGDSVIYFLDADSMKDDFELLGFVPDLTAPRVADKGFLQIDHLTNNVYKGTMDDWARFYKDVFEFAEVRTFDIRGQKTGLTSYALRSPDGSFCIPINEASEKKSQINEYLEEYNGPGIQHLAFLTGDILASLKSLEGTSIQMLDIQDGYYDTVFKRVPQVTEDRDEIRKRNVLVDGDSEGYLLQIFTKNIVGPIFIEIIQRKNHLSFGEGNFQALFDSIERDQIKRGVLT